MDIPLLLIILIVLTIIAINYTFNNLRQNTITSPPPQETPSINGRTRVFDFFEEDKLKEINDFFGYNIDQWETTPNGLCMTLCVPLVTNYTRFKFHIGVGKTIKANTLIVFPHNENSNWWSSFYLKCKTTGCVFYPEPNSVLLSEHDLMVIGGSGSEKLVLSD
jgi:hypothetical protein